MARLHASRLAVLHEASALLLDTQLDANIALFRHVGQLLLHPNRLPLPPHQPSKHPLGLDQRSASEALSPRSSRPTTESSWLQMPLKTQPTWTHVDSTQGPMSS